MNKEQREIIEECKASAEAIVKVVGKRITNDWLVYVQRKGGVVGDKLQRAERLYINCDWLLESDIDSELLVSVATTRVVNHTLQDEPNEAHSWAVIAKSLEHGHVDNW